MSDVIVGLKSRVVNFLHNPYTAWIILAISLSFTFLAWYISSTFSEEVDRSRFDFRVNEIVLAIQDRMNIYEQVLWGGVALMNTQDNITRENWKDYVETLKVNENWPGIQGIGFSVPVNPAEKDLHEQMIRAEGYPDYLIRPEGIRDEYSAIIYLEPFDWRNQRAFGYDMWSNDMRREAMKRAMETGEAATSGIITLVQETKSDVQNGFLTYLPVYKRGAEVNTIEERKEAFLGWVYSPFRANDLMYGILGSEDLNYQFEIYDGNELKTDALLFDSDTICHLSSNIVPIFSSTINVDIQGRPWTIYFETVNVQSGMKLDIPKIIAFGGVVVDLLLFYVIFAIYSIQKRATDIAEIMTAELDNTNRELNIQKNFLSSITEALNKSAIISVTDAKGNIIEVNELFCDISGYTRAELIGQNHRLINSGHHSKEFWKGMYQTVYGGKYWRADVKNLAKDGSIYWVDTMINPIYDINGKLERLMSIRYVITDRKQVVEENEKLVASLKSALTDKNTLIQELHHRIKNNLQLVISLLYLKLRSTKDNKIKDFINETSLRIHSVSKIHEQLLHMESHNKLNSKTYIEDLVQNLMGAYTSNSDDCELKMDVADAELGIDKILIVGLLINEIVSNSIKHAFSNGAKKNIEVNFAKVDTGDCILTVADNGNGMTDELYKKKSNSYGIQLIQVFASPLRANMETNFDQGTKYTIKFKCHA